MAEYRISAEIACKNCGSALKINFEKTDGGSDAECEVTLRIDPIHADIKAEAETKVEDETEAKAKVKDEDEVETKAKTKADTGVKAEAAAESARQKPSLLFWLMPKLCMHCGNEMGSFLWCKSCQKPNIRKALLAYASVPLLALASALSVGHFKPLAYLRFIGDYETLSSRGIESAGNADYQKAIEYFNAALKVSPDSYEALYNRGNAYEGKGSYDQAIADFDAALRTRPADGRALSRRGDTYKRKGSYDQAIADYEAVLRIDSTNADAEQNIESLRKKRKERNSHKQPTDQPPEQEEAR